MRKYVQQSIGEAKSKMNAYVVLLSLRYSNLCVKAEPAALLSVSVPVDGEDVDIEKVASVAIPREDQLAVIPNDPDHLTTIGESVLRSHPEFKMEKATSDGSDDEEDRYLLFTMPEVNKDRYDLLENGVKGLYDQCKVKVDGVFSSYTARIVQKMAGAPPEVIDKVKDQLKEIYDFYDEIMEKYTADKLKEIEEAYQKYLTEHAERQQQKQEEQAAIGKEAVSSMKLPDMGEDVF